MQTGSRSSHQRCEGIFACVHFRHAGSAVPRLNRERFDSRWSRFLPEPRTLSSVSRSAKELLVFFGHQSLVVWKLTLAELES